MSNIDLWAGAPCAPRRWQAEALPVILESLAERKNGVVWATTGGGKSKLLSQLSSIIHNDLKDGELIVISTPTQSLVDQLSATVSEFIGPENVGRFYANRKQVRPVTVTCNPSLPKLAVQIAAKELTTRLLICDEVHSSQSATLLSAIPELNPKTRIGFTATPFRSDAKETLELWDEVLYRYSFGDALRDKVLVPFRVKNWDGTGPDDNVDRIVADLIAEHARGPGIVSAVKIDDAERYASYLTANGIPAAPIYGAMSKGEQASLIEALRVGELRALVHCQLLAEGVDLPWLRWIAMRRPVGSVVRFVQELGRVLRVDPTSDKDHALVIDPHDLMGCFGLGQVANLGEAVDEAIEAETERKERSDGPGEDTVLPPAKAIEVATSWARQLLLLLQAEGFIEEVHASGPWRTRRPSDKQISAIVGRNGKKGMDRHAQHLPEPTRSVVKMLCQPHVINTLQRGAVSDLLSVLSELGNRTFEQRRAFAMGRYPKNRFKFPDFALPELTEAAVLGIRSMEG